MLRLVINLNQLTNMHLFINDKPVKIITPELYQKKEDRYHLLITKDEKLKPSDLEGKVAVIEPTAGLIKKLLSILRDKPLKKLQSLTFVTEGSEILKGYIKSDFKIVKAAGGLVLKEGKILLMYRLGKWDFPKGKLEKDEKSPKGALREVEEECNIKVVINSKIVSTWHTYTLNGSKILKRTKWYAMSCLDDSKMKPQVEESIEQLVWVDPDMAEKLLASTYQSIKFVFEKYFEKEIVF